MSEAWSVQRATAFAARGKPIVVGAVGAAFAAAVIVPTSPWLLDALVFAAIATATARFARALHARDRDADSEPPRSTLAPMLMRAALAVAFARVAIVGGDAGHAGAMWGAADVTSAALGGASLIAIAIVDLFALVRGAERLAEVSARVALDAVPAQLLAVDSELRSGAIDARAARLRREELVAGAQRSGALDGASKLARGEVTALTATAFLLLLARLGRALAIGTTPLGEATTVAIAECASIGVALLLPASIDVATLVLEVEGTKLRRALTPDRTKAASLGAIAVVILSAWVPRAPTIALAAIACGLAWVAFSNDRTSEKPARLVVTIGAQWVREDERLTIERARDRACDALGLPRVTLAIEANPVAKRSSITFDGAPIGGDLDLRFEALSLALDRAIANEAPALVDLDATHALVERLAVEAPTLVAASIPSPLPLATLRDVLRALLAEGTSVRDLRAIVETVAPVAATSRDPRALAEVARVGLRRSLSRSLVDASNRLPVIVLDRVVADTVRAACVRSDGATKLVLGPAARADVLAAIAVALERAPHARAILTDDDARPFVREIVGRSHPTIAIVTTRQLADDVVVETVGAARPA